MLRRRLLLIMYLISKKDCLIFHHNFPPNSLDETEYKMAREYLNSCCRVKNGNPINLAVRAYDAVTEIYSQFKLLEGVQIIEDMKCG